MFSDLEEPSSERMAKMKETREAISASRDEMYSVRVNVSMIHDVLLKHENRPFRLTLKFLALILFLSCLFSLLFIFLTPRDANLRCSYLPPSQTRQLPAF